MKTRSKGITRRHALAGASAGVLAAGLGGARERRPGLPVILDGGGGVVAAMIAAERLGANHATILAYANSGDITGDKSRVVGYGAVALTKDTSKQGSHGKEFRLSGKEQGVLMDIARKSETSPCSPLSATRAFARLAQGS